MSAHSYLGLCCYYIPCMRKGDTFELCKPLLRSRGACQLSKPRIIILSAAGEVGRINNGAQAPSSSLTAGTTGKEIDRLHLYKPRHSLFVFVSATVKRSRLLFFQIDLRYTRGLRVVMGKTVTVSTYEYEYLDSARSRQSLNVQNTVSCQSPLGFRANN